MVYRRKVRDRARGDESVFIDTIVLSPNDIVAFFCETLKRAQSAGAVDRVRLAKLSKHREGLKKLRSWEKIFGDGFFNSCAEPLSLITTDVRWDNNLNQFVVLSFMEYICDLLPDIAESQQYIQSPRDIRLSDFWKTEGSDLDLLWYGLYADNPREDSYPYMTVSGPKGLSFKIDVNYPNITLSKKRAKEVFQKKNGWLMRYVAEKGSARLQRAPAFFVKFGDGFSQEPTVEPTASDIEGIPARFSWLELGEAVKILVETSVFLAAELMLNEGQMDIKSRYSEAYGQVSNVVTPEGGMVDIYKVQQDLKRVKILFDAACLYSGVCAQFALPLGFSRGLSGSLDQNDRIFSSDSESFLAPKDRRLEDAFWEKESSRSEAGTLDEGSVGWSSGRGTKAPMDGEDDGGGWW